MRQPQNKFRYVVTNRLGVLQVAPLGESNFTIEWSREDEGKLDYKKELPSKILFRGEAFANLLKLEQSIYRCDFVQIAVERRCMAGGQETWAPWFSGRMSFNDGTWDLDRCEVEIKFDDIKEAQCFEENKSKELNLLSAVSYRRAVLLNPTNITIEKVTYSHEYTAPNSPCTVPYWGGSGQPFNQGWRYYAYDNTIFYNIDGSIASCEVSASWAREVIELACTDPAPASEWVLISDTCPGGVRKYARPVRTYACTYTLPDYGSQVQQTTYQCKIVGDSEVNVLIDNGMPLERIIEAFVNAFCPGYTFVSNFFQINPDVVTAVNYVTGMTSKTRYITVFQKSDVKRPTATANATRATMSFDKLITALVTMFNLAWRVEGTTIRMEHVSWFSRSNGFDLTQTRWAKWMVGKRKYSYDSQEIPAKEEFKFMEASYGDFSGVPILYAGGCVSQSSRDNVKTYSVDNVSTDLELIIGNPDPDSKVVSDDGFVFVAADYDGTDYFVITESSILGGAQLNNSLAWAQLQRDYHKYNRPLRNGTMNNEPTQFLSVKPTKKGVPITIPLCCGDYFDPDQLITTPLGVGIVDKATFSFRDETLEMELLYVADDNLTTNIAPAAGNDTAETFLNTPVNINVLANDGDADGSIMRVEIVIQPSHGTAVVNTNGVIVYTPTTGYTGNDNIVYRVFDDWNEPSNAALISIVVRATNQAPVANNDSYTGEQDTVLTVPAGLGVFANDTDDNGFALDTYTGTSVQGGTVVLNSNGSFTYTPPSGFSGMDSFTYQIRDIQGLTDSATVTIEVRNPNNPIAVDDSYQTRINQNLSMAAPGVLANDTTTVGSLTTLPQTVPTFNGGTVTIGSNGSFTYTTPTNFTGNDSFIYTAANGSGTDQATVTVRVLPNIYVKLQQLQNRQDSIRRDCGSGQVIVGEQQTAIFRLFFYSNSAGTIPMNIDGLGLRVNVRINGRNYDNSTYINNFTVYPTSGSTFTLFGGNTYAYYVNENNCFGGNQYFKDESISVAAGLYTII